MSRVSLSDLVPGGQPEPPNRRGSARAKERRKKRKRRRSWLVLLVAFGMLGGAGYGAYAAIMPMVRAAMEPNDFTGAGSGKVPVVVPEGASGTTIGRVLDKAGVVKTVAAFVDAFKANPDSGAVQPGTYNLKERMSADEALAALLDPANRVERKVTIAEGKRLAEIVELLAVGTGLQKVDLQTELKKPAGLGLPAEAGGNLEGWLFPATYTVAPTTTAHDLLASMIARTVAELTGLKVPQNRWKPVIVEASLVQAEAGTFEDMPKIARVFANRFRIKRPLELDTTVHYAKNSFKIKTTYADTRFPSPYNTYLHPGLPPGAICSPGAQAIRAVLAPAAGTWIYFTTVDPDTGETKFATTLAEKAAMDAEFRAWQKLHPNA